MIARRRLLHGASQLALLGLAAPLAARALPARLDIGLMVGAPAGAGGDQQARAFAPFLERHLPRTGVQVMNVPGEAGLASVRQLATSAADGSLLGWVSTPALPARMVDRNGRDLLHQITLLGAVQQEPVVIVSSADAPLGNVQDLFRRNSDDADAPPLGTPQAGSSPHLAALRLQLLAGRPLNLIAFPSVGAVREAVLAGNLPAAALALGDVIDALRDGRLVGVGLAVADRLTVLPDIPTLAEGGLDLVLPILRGLAVPGATPAPVVARLKAALQAVAEDSEFTAQADANGFVAGWIDGADWLARADSEQAELARLWHAGPWLALGTG